MPEEQINNNASSNTLHNPAEMPSQKSPLPTNPPIKHPTMKTRLKVSIIIGIIILAVLSIFGAYLFIANQNINQNLSMQSVSASPTIAPEDALRVPNLYPEFEWEEVDNSEPWSYLTNHDGESEFYIDSNRISVKTPGKQWHYQFETNDSEDINAQLSGFWEYLHTEFDRLGWSNSLNQFDNKITAIAADGPGGGITGFIKIVADKMRLIVVQTQTNITFRTSDECPCSISYNIFISDIFSTSELEK